MRVVLKNLFLKNINNLINHNNEDIFIALRSPVAPLCRQVSLLKGKKGILETILLRSLLTCTVEILFERIQALN